MEIAEYVGPNTSTPKGKEPQERRRYGNINGRKLPEDALKRRPSLKRDVKILIVF
jgi:hypothetical protein